MLTHRVTCIVSGGQTGADRGAMDAAIALCLPYGGWATAGYRAEDGTIPAIYASKMLESKSAEYGMRTRLNVQDSDGTLIITFAAELSGGSAYTGRAAAQQRKPAKHLVLPARGRTRITEPVRAAVLAWLADRRIGVLNVAGPRESKEPGIQQAVRDALVWLLEDAVADVPAPVWPLGHCEGCIGAGCETVGCPNHGTWGSEVRHPPQRAVEEPDAEVGDIEVTEIDMFASATDSDQPRALHAQYSRPISDGDALDYPDDDPDDGPCVPPIEQAPDLIAASAAIRAEIAFDHPEFERVNLTCEQPGYNGIGKLE